MITDRAWLAAGRDAMRYRGPDDQGEWWSSDGCVGLAFRRLAIIDLSSGGRQPMQDPAGALCIVFNGEIYNFQDVRQQLASAGFQFRSKSDTEVILAAYAHWGTDCLAHLNGMFAFALYDASRRRMFLARDRAGEKPLFYRYDRQAIRFASELKGLLADPAIPRRIDPEAMDCYLALGYAPGERSILQGFHQLPPAHALTFELTSGICRRWRYWEVPPTAASAGAIDENRLINQLDELLQNGVRDRLVADVPVGIMLSGGVDSSLVAAMAVRARPNIRTYTVRFPGTKYDETEHARLIARHFETDHVEVEAAEATIDLLPTLAREYDQPIIDSSMVPTYLVSRAIRSHCKVALGGDGGDELFGGYSAYDRLMHVQRTMRSFPRSVRQLAAAVADAVLPVGFRGRNWLPAISANFETEVPTVGFHFDRRSRRSMMARHQGWRLAAEEIHQDRTPRGADLLDRAMRMDFENYLPEDILVKVDRASMLNSLEVRAPMLDHRIIEFAFGRVPIRLKVDSTRRKVLLKKLAARILPPAFDLRRKQGFSIPLESWLRTSRWQQYFRDVLLDSGQVLFERRFVTHLLDAQMRGRRNGERLFGLLMFELWRREYCAAL